MAKIDSSNMAETDRYYHPIPQVVTKLPDPKTVRSFTEVFIKNADGTHNSYKMVNGQWLKTGANLGV